MIMKKIRIGKDITVRWRILVNGNSVHIEGMALQLVMTDPFGKRSYPEFTVEDDTVGFVFAGTEQRHIGAYSLTLWVNHGQKGQTALDACDFVQLVSCTCLEDTTWDGVITDTVELSGNLDAGVKGESAYEIWIKQGHKGTEEDFLVWLRQPATDVMKGTEMRRLDITYENGTTETLYVLAKKRETGI